MKQSVKLTAFLLLVLGTAIPQTSCGQESPKPDPLRHVVVIGASASAGYGTGSELSDGEDVTLADLLRAMIPSKTAKVTDASDEMFILAPDATAAEQARKARESDPSCVVAIDYLYWLGLGAAASFKEVQGRLTAGLKHLEGFECPVLISAIPPIRGVKEAPDPKVLDGLNRNIEAWAAAHPNVIIVPLEKALLDLLANEAVQAAGHRWSPPEALLKILQKDGRHPTVLGLGLIAGMCLEALIEMDLVTPGDVALDARAAAKAALDR